MTFESTVSGSYIVVSYGSCPPCPAPVVSSPLLSELDSLVESITGQIKNEWTTFFNGSGADKYGLDSLNTMLYHKQIKLQAIYHLKLKMKQFYL